MKKYDPSKPLISLHIPKCAGTSFSFYLKRWFGDNLYLHYYHELSGKMPDRHSLKKSICIHGHFHHPRGFGVEDYYPEACQFITFLRSPLEQAISNYFYLKKCYHLEEGFNKINFDVKKEYGSINGYLINHPHAMITYLPYSKDINMNNFKEIIQKNYIYIGISEDFETAIINLSSLLGFPYIENLEIPRENISRRDEDVSNKAIETFVERNQLIFELYNYCKTIYNKSEVLKNNYRPVTIERYEIYLKNIEKMIYEEQKKYEGFISDYKETIKKKDAYIDLLHDKIKNVKI